MSVDAITLDVLRGTDEQSLWELISEYVNGLVDNAPPKERDRLIETLPLGLQLVYDLDGVEFDVPNGGFGQFFYNSTGLRALETVEALRVVGALQRAEILEKAIDLYDTKWGRPRVHKERWLHSHASCPGEDRLNEEYCRLSTDNLEPLDPLVAKYIRNNPAHFMHPVG